MTNALSARNRPPELPTYEDACRYLAAMIDLDPVMEIEHKADGLKEYAIKAKDPLLLEQAIRIRFEATKNIGRIIREMQARGELATQGSGGRNQKRVGVPPGEHRKTLKDIGLTRRQSSGAQWLLDLSKREYDRRVTSIVKKTVGQLNAIFRQAWVNERKAALYARSEIAPGLHLGDFRELSPELIEDASIELVFIDPPYDRDSLPLYADAATEAKRILRPGGSLISYVGHSIMPQAARSMAEHLTYFWTGAAVHGGQNRRMDLMGIIAGFKPLLWFVKDYRGDIQTLVADTVTGTGREKEFHEWQQAENEAAHFIEPLTSDDGTVVDFFAGGGTTLVAARNLKRRYIGFEIDPQRAARAAERLTEM
jgi:hypothetical protein